MKWQDLEDLFATVQGPQELEAVPGGREELDRLVAQLDFSKR